MKIGINFEDTLTDSNYSLIDIINSKRDKDNHISYEEFDESGYPSIWEYPELTLEELDKKEDYLYEMFDDMDLVVLAKIEIKEILKEGHEFIVFSEYEEKFKRYIKKFLERKGLSELSNRIICGINEYNISDWLDYEAIDMYIEDNPYLIKEIDSKRIMVVVRSHVYNETCYNLMRLECYSQLNQLFIRASNKIEKIKKKKEKIENL